MSDADRLFVDDVMVSLLVAEERILSLESDVQAYRLMVSELLTRLYSQNAQVERLMFRLRQEPTRG